MHSIHIQGVPKSMEPSYAIFKLLRVVGQPNLEIVSTKMLPTSLDHDKGTRAL